MFFTRGHDFFTLEAEALMASGVVGVWSQTQKTQFFAWDGGCRKLSSSEPVSGSEDGNACTKEMADASHAALSRKKWRLSIVRRLEKAYSHIIELPPHHDAFKEEEIRV